MTTTKTGTVKFIKKDKGFGFIIDNETNNEVFVHVTNCKSEIRSGDQVKYDEVMGKKGTQALNVELLS